MIKDEKLRRVENDFENIKSELTKLLEDYKDFKREVEKIDNMVIESLNVVTLTFKVSQKFNDDEIARIEVKYNKNELKKIQSESKKRALMHLKKCEEKLKSFCLSYHINIEEV